MIKLEFETIEEFNAFILSIRGYNYSLGWTTGTLGTADGSYKVDDNSTAEKQEPQCGTCYDAEARSEVKSNE